MPRPKTLRDRMQNAIQLGIPEPQPSSIRSIRMAPTAERRDYAADLLRRGVLPACVAEVVGLSEYAVGVIAECVRTEWNWEPVVAEDWELEARR